LPAALATLGRTSPSAMLSAAQRHAQSTTSRSGRRAPAKIRP
jgi:hypothetical protein